MTEPKQEHEEPTAGQALLSVSVQSALACLSCRADVSVGFLSHTDPEHNTEGSCRELLKAQRVFFSQCCDELFFYITIMKPA